MEDIPMPTLFGDMLAGCAAGAAQDLFLHPIDTLRARLDVGGSAKAAAAIAQPAAAGASPSLGNPARMMLLEARNVIAADGLLGLYRGYGLCLIGSAPANALYFSSYQVLKRLLRPAGIDGQGSAGGASFVRDSAAGFGAEVVAAGLWTPLDIVKQRMQVSTDAHLSVFAATRAACAGVGIRGLWRGYFAGLCVWGPFSASYFGFFETVKQALPGEGTATTTASGVLAGAVAAVLTQPLDCAKTRLQVGACEPGATFLQVLRRTYANEGSAALMRGAVARALWLAPGCGLSMTVFEFFSKALGGSCARR